MKKKLQWLGKVFFLSVAILLWAGCENDEIGSRLDSDSQITKRLITLGELRQKASDYEKLQIVEQKIESNRQSPDGRMEYDSLYGFYIDTEKILLIEKAGYYSYTIPIKRDAENGKVENLVLSFDADGTFKSYLTAYSLTAEEKNQLSDGEKVANLETKTSIAALSDNAASSGGSGAGIFHDANGNCFVINHIWTDQSGTLAWNYVQVDCPADSGGGSGEGSGDNAGSNPGGWPGNYPDPGGYENPGGGGTGENGGEVITEPILPNMAETPCAKLKKLISISGGPNLKATIANIKANVDGYCEHGAQFKKVGNVYSVINLPSVNSGPGADGVIHMRAEPGLYGDIHTHPKICYPMFSFADLYASYEMVRRAGPELFREAVYMLAVENPAYPNQPSKNLLYALKIENFQAFESFIGSMFGAAEVPLGTIVTSLTDEQRKPFINIIDKNLSALYSEDMGNLDRVLLRFMANGGGGASLYQANDEITNWTKISLNATDPNNGPVTKQPCN